MGKRMNVDVPGYYKPGADKFSLTIDQLKHSENIDANKILQRAIDDVKSNNPTGYGVQSLDEMNQVLKGKDRIGRLRPDGTYDYNNLIERDSATINKIKKAAKSGKLYGLKGVGEYNYLIEKNIVEDLRGQNPDKRYRVSKPLKLSRHEIAKNEMINHVHGLKTDYARLNDAGISKPQPSSGKALFSGIHKDVMDKQEIKSWDKITHSRVINDIDRSDLTKANKTDIKWLIGEEVTEKVNLKGKGVRENIRNVASKFIKDTFHKGTYGLRRHSLQNPEKALSEFLDNYKVRDGRLIFNYSPVAKPNFLLGGVNTNVVMYKNPSYKRILGKTIPKGKVIYDALTTDKYDITGSALQRRTHINHHHSSNIPGGLWNPKKYTPNRKKFLKAVKNKDLNSIIKYGKNMAGRSFNILRANWTATRNPVFKLALFVLSRGKIKVK